MYWQSGRHYGSFICIDNQDATMGVLYVLTIRTPLWEAICFTQTGQRSGELTANSDQVSARECPGAEVCVSSYFAAAKDALSSFA